MLDGITLTLKSSEIVDLLQKRAQHARDQQVKLESRFTEISQKLTAAKGLGLGDQAMARLTPTIRWHRSSTRSDLSRRRPSTSTSRRSTFSQARRSVCHSTKCSGSTECTTTCAPPCPTSVACSREPSSSRSSDPHRSVLVFQRTALTGQSSDAQFVS
jgi:Rod binding domain-containing protein